MPDWESLRHFLALATEGTLLGAARAMGVEHATVSRRVALLEEQLQVKLVDRRGRRITLTAEGEHVAALARRMEEQAVAINQARLNSERLVGTVRISAPPSLSDIMLPRSTARLRRRHPGIDIVLAGEKHYASLNRREADIAVRLTRPVEGDLTVSRIGTIRFDFYASADYLAETLPEEWSFIAYDSDMETSLQHKRLMQVADGRRIGLRASTLEFQRAVAQAGGGIAMLPDFFVRPTDGLVIALAEDEPVTRDIWLVVHSDIHDMPIIRAVMDAIREGVGHLKAG